MAVTRQRSNGGPTTITGAVRSPDGTPVTDAAVFAIDGTAAGSSSTLTDEEGQFTLQAGANPVWVRTRHPDFVAQTAAAAPGDDIRVELTPAQGPDGNETVSLSFGGDVMFGRRYYESDTDPLSSSYRLTAADRRGAHRRLLAPIAPLLDTADVTSVNLETPLTTAPWRHPDKTFTFTSHPVAADSLGNAGVDYLALGNTHTFDALTPGLEDTIDAAESAGLAHSGAGFSSDAAWEPALLDRGGMTLAYVSCTTTAGQQYDIDWSADRDPAERHAIMQNGQTITVQGTAGVAEASVERVQDRVSAAAATADFVVVQIHGGEEYQRQPTDEMVTLTDAAVQAGAGLVVNHHPHVTGGLAVRDGTPVAWSLGNLVFDQTLWETYRSFVLTAHVRDGTVVRVLAEPVLLEGYVPRGVTGRTRRQLLWELAGLSDRRISLGRRSLGGRFETEEDTTPGGSVQQTFENTGDEETAVFGRESGWIADVESTTGTTRLGRNRLVTGEFENVDVDADRYEGPLWRFSRTRFATGPNVGKDNTGGIELTRTEANNTPTLLTPRNRIPCGDSEFTLTGQYRSNAQSGLSILVAWYDDTRGSSFGQLTLRLVPSEREWERFRARLFPPDGARFVNFFIRLSPPSNATTRRAVFDNIALIEWETPGVTGGRSFDHLRVEERATVTMRSPAGVDGPPVWPRVV